MGGQGENEEPLFRNAVGSLQVGIEDYEDNNQNRALAAVRNFYAGLLLLAKAVLARRVPDVDPMEVIGASYKPVLDEDGELSYVAANQRTVDFDSLAKRFEDFRIPFDKSALGALRVLNRIRNEIEHHYTNAPREAVREAIARAFPVVADLFRLLGENPAHHLGGAWATMLNVKDTYERELAACRQTFKAVEWGSQTLAVAAFKCPQCQSDLVAQADPDNRDQRDVKCTCRACGASIAAEDAIEAALENHLAGYIYPAAKDGGEPPLVSCPECGKNAYIQDGEENECAACGYELEDSCASCGTHLTPNDAWIEDHSLCSYCGHMMSKDD